TEPRRGAECWGKSPFGYFWLAGIPGSFPKVTRSKSGTISRRYRNNGYVLMPSFKKTLPIRIKYLINNEI
ncbi:hypothetical protein, partial [Pseudomonas viridiflava]|uniref:hypothetical protein n=1 Tax=Pseudomonas viridiflava TaxID=33069 RepID=UPI001981C93A